MAKIICANSGVEFQCEHLPLAISSRDITHPLFSLHKRKLLSLASQWSMGKLTPTENYLLYLSLLGSTDLIEWRVPARYHSGTQQIIANNMEQLLHIIGKIDVITHPSFVLPHFVISNDTCALDNSYHWIQIWNQNYNDWSDNIKDHSNDQELTRRENAVNKLIRTSHKNIEDYPSILAEWAAIAGDFPTLIVRILGKDMELADYWKSIIVKCAKDSSLIGIPDYDLNELLRHCVDNFAEEGSLRAIALLKYLRNARTRLTNLYGLGEDLAPTKLTAYRLLEPETSAEDANIQNMIDNAPLIEPTKKDYPTLILYLKAKARWDIKVAFEKESPSTPQSFSPTN